MARKRYTPEDISQKLREAEVLLSQGQTIQQVARILKSVSRPTIAGAESMVGWTRARRSAGTSWSARIRA